MDGMRIKSEFLTMIVSKVIKKAIKKKSGYDIDIQIKEFNVNFDNDGNATVRVEADGSLKKEELLNILKGVGMG